LYSENNQKRLHLQKIKLILSDIMQTEEKQTQYINPFQRNSFFERVANVTAFWGQNIGVILFMQLIATVLLFFAEVDNDIEFAAVSVVGYTIMLTYIKNKRLQGVALTEYLKSFIITLLKSLIAGVVVTVVALVIILLSLLIIQMWVGDIAVLFERDDDYQFYVCAFLMLIEFVYFSVIANIFNAHYIMSEGYNVFESLKETFAVIYGKWWNTALFLLFFSVPFFCVYVFVYTGTFSVLERFLLMYLCTLSSMLCVVVPLVYQCGCLMAKESLDDEGAVVDRYKMEFEKYNKDII
jgi:hypothetical protein